MKAAVLLAIRTVSRRLPHKVLRQIRGKTVVEQIVERLRLAARTEDVIVCTSDEPCDDIVADLAETSGWTYFRGGGQDVMERFYLAARSFGVDLIVRAQGDNLFVCPEHIDWMIDKHLDAGADWATVDGLPFGMKSETISFAAMERAYYCAEDRSQSEYLTWFFDQPEYFKTLHIPAREEYRRPDYRVTLDTPQDLLLLRRICQAIDKAPARITTSEIIALLDSEPELARLNATVPDRTKDTKLRAEVNTRMRMGTPAPRRRELKIVAAETGEAKTPRPTRDAAAEDRTLIVAEIGQNHNGSAAFGRALIDIAAMPVIDHFTSENLPGVDAVKLTKRDLDEELTGEAAGEPYHSPHSFGRTYGEHRRALELSYEEHRDLGNYAHEKGLLFVETLCSPRCLRLCEMVEIDYLKVASRDLTNIPLLREMAWTRIPIILSTGMGDFRDLDAALEEITRIHDAVTILHCISEYPARYENIGLPRIQELIARYPRQRIGYSDHSIGIVVPVAAVCLGATVIEKHITLSHGLKGSDHAGALEPEGLWRMTRDIRNTERTLRPVSDELRERATETSRRKLRRSLATRVAIEPGGVIAEEDLVMLSPGDGLEWAQRHLVVGKRAKTWIPAQAQVRREMVG